MSASHSTSSLAVNANMANEAEMSTSVRETETTNTSDQVLEAGLAQRIKRQISQLHRETNALEEVKQQVHHDIVTTRQKLLQLETQRVLEDAKQQELDGLARQRLLMEEEAIRAEIKQNIQFVLCVLVGLVCFLVFVGVEVASCYWDRTIVGDVGQWAAVGGCTGMIVWVPGSEVRGRRLIPSVVLTCLGLLILVGVRVGPYHWDDTVIKVIRWVALCAIMGMMVWVGGEGLE
ncbi:hypothetical protein LTR17_000488 [Elasticomyces elasticus]|nr:hypothetical protein LTR17_000488 [Elasticomyces elasticus]